MASMKTSPSCCLVLLVIVLASADHPVIKAETGQNVFVKCLSPNTGLVSVLECIRTDEPERNVLMHRGKTLVTDNQLERYISRVELLDPDLKNGNFSWLLKNVTGTDSATYECRIAQKRTRRKRADLDSDPICTITLTVENKNKDGDTNARDNKDGEAKAGLNNGMILGCLSLYFLFDLL